MTQALCSALPIACCKHPKQLWEPFARLVLEATYEATFAVAYLNSRQTGTNRVYLMRIGRDLYTCVRRELQHICGIDLLAAADETFHMKRYTRLGMSGDYVDPPTRQFEIVPLLIARWATG